MKLRNHSLLYSSVLLLALSVFMSGCTMTGMERSVKTSNSIQDVDNDIRKIMVQIDATSAALDTLVMAGQPDLKKSFDVYADNLAELDRQGKRVNSRMEEMKLRSYEYFSEWEKQGETYTNPQIRELSEDRRKKLADIYAQVPAASSGIKSAYLASMTNLQEIKLYLSNDLTPQGVAAIDPIAKEAVKNLDDLKTSYRPVIYALDEIKAELSSGQK